MQGYGRLNLRHGRALIAILAFAIPFASSGVAVAAPNDGILGGPPSTELGSTVCPAGKGVTGVTGRLGTISFSTIVASATVQCQDGAAAEGSIGSTTDPQGSTSCGPGQVAVGIEGREGDFIDQLAVRCRAADLTGPTTSAVPFGGTGGAADGPYDCPEGQQLVGLDGSIVLGDTVRHVQIRCAPPDADADGIADAEDNCPTQPGPVSNGGCPTDTSPPNTTITGSPKAKTKKKKATFTFTGTDARAISGFECSLNGAPFTSCTSPLTVKGKKGKNHFEVRAKDTEGNVDPTPATFDWKVKKKKKK